MENSLVAQLLKKFQPFMETESLLPCPQEPSIGPYLELDESNPYHPILFLKDSSKYNPPPMFKSS
jgi:hypothetical protein